MKRYIIAITLCIVLIAGLSHYFARPNKEHIPKPEPSRLIGIAKPWTGDYEAMKARRTIRVLVPQSRTFYFLDGAKERGISYEIARDFETWLNKKYPKAPKIHIVIIPVTWEELLPALNQGLGDIAMGGITITPERRKNFDFSIPMASGVKEIVVTGPASPQIKTPNDLSGKNIYVRPGSSYAEHLHTLNGNLKVGGKSPIKIIDIDASLKDEDILEMVNAGLIPLTVMDSYLVNAWSGVLTKITPHPDLAVNQDGDLAWAFRQNSPELKAVIDEYVSTHKAGTTFANTLINRYFKSTKFLLNAGNRDNMKRFNDVVGFFQTYGKTYDFDYLMLLAQGYQESQLDQSVRSHRGAVGIMQLLPKTAKDPNVDIDNIDKSAQNNIHAGTKYLRYLADHYVQGSDIDDKNRLLLSFAAYNAGPGNLRKFREDARKSGRNPDIWFNNVEFSAARIVGQETVQYVSNIYKYYVAYKLILGHEGGQPEH